MIEETLNLLALSLIPGLGTVRTHRLLKHFGSPQVILRLSRRELRRLGLSDEIRSYVISGRALKEAEERSRKGSEMGIEILSFLDERFPRLLKQIYDPPVILYAKGDLSVLSGPAIAVVGSRRASWYGRQVSFILSKELAGLGLTIVSGLARGIDTHAHRGALEAKGRTVAVLGTGIDVVYPRENRKIYDTIVQSGCIITEFPLGTYAAPQNFPIRNRIISGLSLGTLIPEAAEFSGSLITARLTLEQNRELWAVPGNITSSGSYGPNYLIKQGAKPVICARDVLDELPIDVLNILHTQPEEDVTRHEKKAPTSEKERVLRLIPVDDSIHFDRLLSKGSQTAAALNMHLLDLEMEGRIKQIPGRHFVRLL